LKEEVPVMSSLKWQIGDIEIFQLAEMEIGFIVQSLVPDAQPEIIKEIDFLYPDFADEDGNLKSLTQAFLIKTADKNVLVDAGVGNGKERVDFAPLSDLQTDFLSRLSELGVGVDDIDYVIQTHLDLDHVGWNTTLVDGKWAPTFPNAKYIYVEGEYEFWKTKPEFLPGDFLRAIEDSIEPVVEAGQAMFVDNSFKLDDNISLRPSKGHTVNHVSVVIESGGEKAIIFGDVLHHPAQVAHPEWNSVVDHSPEDALATRAVMLNEVADTNILLIGSHFHDPVAGYVKRSGDKLIFVT